MADIRDKIIAKATGLDGKPPGEDVSEVRKQTEDMSVIDKAMDTARKLAGTTILQDQLTAKDQKVDKLQKEKEEKDKDIQKAQLQVIEVTLGGKIDQLAQSIKSGANTKTISEQITEIKSVANDLGLGGSRFSDIKDIMMLIQSLNPQKGLTDQVKDARELLSLLQPAREATTTEGLPASVVVEIKKMDHDLQLTLEKMKDDREASREEFALEVEKWKEEREQKRMEIAGKIKIETDRNELIAGGFKTVGAAIAQGLVDKGGGISSQGSQPSPQSFKIRAGPMDSGEIDCPICTAKGMPTKIGIGPTTTLATCVGCGSQFNIERTPTTEPSTDIKQEV